MIAVSGRLPRPRLILLVITSLVGMATIIALKLCNDKYQLYKEFASLERLGRDVEYLERGVDDLGANVVQLETRRERVLRRTNLTTGKGTKSRQFSTVKRNS